MMLFSTGTRLERVGVVGSDLDCWQAGLLDARLSALNRSTRASPVAAPMLKSVSF